MKHVFILLLAFLVVGSPANAQKDEKNTIYFGYSIMEAKSPVTGGEISAKGFEWRRSDQWQINGRGVAFGAATCSRCATY